MHADMFVVRHAESGAPYLIAQHLRAPLARARDQRRRRPPRAPDAGPARHVHHPPLQEGFHQAARGDRRRHPALARGALRHPCADHAGRARSARGRAATLVPGGLEQMGVRVFTRHERRHLKDVDVIIMLRLQNERMSGALLPSAQEFFKSFGLTPEKLALAKPDAIVMHPGPMNRGVEIDSAVADGEQAVILPQVTFGIAVRMAVMSIVAGN